MDTPGGRLTPVTGGQIWESDGSRARIAVLVTSSDHLHLVTYRGRGVLHVHHLFMPKPVQFVNVVYRIRG